jgi:excisionase family DNA binding protein
VAQITTIDAAARLNVSPRRVGQLIQAGRLKAKKYGRDWLIDERNLAAVADRKPGRPRRREARA